MQLSGNISKVEAADGGFNVAIEGNPDTVFVPEGIATSGPDLEVGQVVTMEVEDGRATSLAHVEASSGASPVSGEGDSGGDNKG